MAKDMTVPCEDGLISVRVGAIIMKDGKILMVSNGKNDYLYTVGGRVKFGETAEEAIVREVEEETGVRMEIDRLGFVNENYFYGDVPSNMGKLIYEMSYYFYMKVPEGYSPASNVFLEEGNKEFLEWVPLDTPVTMYPTFFKSELQHPEQLVKFFTTDERKKEIT